MRTGHQSSHETAILTSEDHCLSNALENQGSHLKIMKPVSDRKCYEFVETAIILSDSNRISKKINFGAMELTF
jgi:hypothetical protein